MGRLLSTYTPDLNKHLQLLIDEQEPLITGYPDFGNHPMRAHLAFGKYYAERAHTLDLGNDTNAHIRKIHEEVNYHAINTAQRHGLHVIHAGPHPNLYTRASKDDILHHEQEALSKYLGEDTTIYYDLPDNLGVEWPKQKTH